MSAALTELQRDVLETIAEFVAARGMPPTVRDLQIALEYRSTYTITCHLRALAKKGYIEVIPRISRGLRLTEKGRAT